MIQSALKKQFGFSTYTILENTEGLTQDECLVRPEKGGNNVYWLLGHILATRNFFYPLIGADPFWSEHEAAPFARTTDGNVDPARVAPVATLLETLQASQETLKSALDATSEADLERELPFDSPPFQKGEPMSGVLAGLAFHESYHAGQIGVLRRMLGKANKLK